MGLPQTSDVPFKLVTKSYSDIKIFQNIHTDRYIEMPKNQEPVRDKSLLHKLQYTLNFVF